MVQYKLSPDVDLQRVENKLIVLDLRNNAYYSLNSSGGFFLQKIADGMTEAEIIDAAADAFEGADRATLEADFAEIVQKMLGLGIIQKAD